jgi:hypothetical protein
MLSMRDVPTIESITDWPYPDYSLVHSCIHKIMGTQTRVIKDSMGAPFPGVEIPSFPVFLTMAFCRVPPQETCNKLKKITLRKAAPAFLVLVRNHCQALGIPAVIDCGDASIHPTNGNRGNVDGGTGMVEIVERA